MRTELSATSSPGEESSHVTPLVLTYNEEVNIGRTLRSLTWASRVVVLDSGSTDGTEKIARGFPNVEWFVRPFDSHRGQWDFGVHGTGITSEYVLALDADMSVSVNFITELLSKFNRSDFDGGLVKFCYAFEGQALKGSVYPGQVRVFRPRSVEIAQVGHTQAFSVKGRVYRFAARVIHDDRKALERWVSAQAGYSKLEVFRIESASKVSLVDRLRLLGLMPPVVLAISYLRAGGPLGGAAAVRYAYERCAYECLLAIRLKTQVLGRQGCGEGEKLA